MNASDDFVSPYNGNIENLYQEITQILETLRFSYEAIISIDEAQNIVIFNKGAEEIFGYTANEVIGQPITFLIPKRFHAMHDRHVEDFMRKEKNDLIMHHNKSIYGLRKNGDEFPAESSIYMFQYGNMKTFTAVLRDVTEAAALKERMYQLATHDHLTMLPNRLLFDDRLSTAISRADRNQKKLALLFIDLDNFKTVNDRLGHRAGDDYLQTIGQRLKHFLRGSDTAARIGGDEFALIMEDFQSRQEVEKTIQHLRMTLEDAIMLELEEYSPSISIGMAVYPDEAADADQMLRQADRAMYADKTSKITKTKN